MKKINKKRIIILCITLFLIITAGTVWAWTDSTWATGELNISLTEFSSNIKQEINGNKRSVAISNTAETPCFVRVKVIAVPNNTINIQTANGWSYNEDGYWYYENFINGEESTNNLEIEVTNKNIKAMIISETTEVWHDNSGNAYADWNKVYHH